MIFGELNEEEKGLIEEKIIITYKKKGINFNVVYYDSANDVYAKFDRKEIDMALISTIQRSEEYRVIAKFAPRTFYIIA